MEAGDLRPAASKGCQGTVRQQVGRTQEPEVLEEEMGKKIWHYHARAG